MINLEGDDLLLWRHLRKGHKKTSPIPLGLTATEYAEEIRKELQEYQDELVTEEQVKHEMISELTRWHSEHHDKDFMRHIAGPYSHAY